MLLSFDMFNCFNAVHASHGYLLSQAGQLPTYCASCCCRRPYLFSLDAGYNTLEEAREPILDYIKRQNSEHIEREQDAKRANPLHKFTDARVDVALFFIAPHRLRPLDVGFMTQLADLVPVVRHICIPRQPDCMMYQTTS